MKLWERIPGTEQALERYVARFRKEVVERLFWGEPRNSAVEYVFVELLNNAYEHGNKRDAGKAIIIEWELEDGMLTVSVQDEGDGFIPRIPDVPPSHRQTRGRGLWSVRADVHSMTFNEKGNKVTVRFMKEGNHE